MQIDKNHRHGQDRIQSIQLSRTWENSLMRYLYESALSSPVLMTSTTLLLQLLFLLPFVSLLLLLFSIPLFPLFLLVLTHILFLPFHLLLITSPLLQQTYCHSMPIACCCAIRCYYRTEKSLFHYETAE